MKKLFFIASLICVWTLGLCPWSWAEVKKVAVDGEKSEKTEKKEDRKLVNIMADQLEHSKEKNKIIGTGNVKIKYQELRLAADRVELNTETGLGSAIGKVVIIDETNGHKIHSDYVRFNIHSKQATLYNSLGKVAKEFYFHGKKVERKSDTHYVISKGDITSCIGNNPFWKFKCAKIDARTGKYALLRDPTFMIKDIPFFYLPYGYVPLDTERQSGILIPKFGSSNEDGAFLNNAFFWAINDQWDATMGLDYLSKRGIRPSGEIRYFTSPTTKGRWYVDYLKDRDTKDTFWKILVDHKEKFPYDVDVNANVEWLEGTDYDKIYSDSVQQRTRRETDNFLTVTKNWESRSLFLETRYHKSLDSYNRSESGTLPQLTFKNQLQKIGETPFFFDMDASYANFASKEMRNTPIDFTRRMDFHPQLSLPFNKWPWLNLTTRAGVRETVYDHGKTGGIDNYNDYLYRSIYNFDTTLDGPSFSKAFTSGGDTGTAYKHLIEPRITHTYISGMGGVNNKIKVNDGIDFIPETNRVNYSLTNRLYEKIVAGESFFTQEVVRFEISQSYDFLAEDKGPGFKPFSDIRFDFESRPLKLFMFNFDSTFNMYDYGLSTVNVETVVKPWENLGFYVERRYTRYSSTDVLGTIRWKFLPSWEIDASSRYDETSRHFRENDASLNYQGQCWGFGLDLIKRVNYYQDQKINDMRFLFQVSLKGLGSYSSKKDAGMDMHRRF
jgi:LPS-assembly protein